ncbi:MAG: hypothetical protein RIR26_912 [Pseudomonadota bacterium]
MNLTSALIAAGLTGLIAVAMVRILGDSAKHQKSIEMKNDSESVKMVLMRRVDCDLTIREIGTSCVPGALVELKEKRGGKTETLVSKEDPPTRFGKIAVRAECTPDGQGVMVKHAWLRKGKSINSENPNDFYDDPVFNKKLSWNDSKTSLLFQSGLNICTLNGRSNGSLPGCYVSRGCNYNQIGPGPAGEYMVLIRPELKKCLAGVCPGGPAITEADKMEALKAASSNTQSLECVDTVDNTSTVRKLCAEGYVYAGPAGYDCKVTEPTSAGKYTVPGSASCSPNNSWVHCCKE